MFKLRKSSNDIIRDMAYSSGRLEKLQKALSYSSDEDMIKLQLISNRVTRFGPEISLESEEAKKLFRQAVKAERDSVAASLGLVLED